MARKGGRTARWGGPVLVDTNAIIEAWRVNAWRALRGGYALETVDECVTETQTGFQRRRKEQQIDREKSCPWCGEDFTADSFRCTPSDIAPQNMEIGCVNSLCAFGKGKPLPVLTVDDAIYRRLPAFLIATVDKFAGLPFIDKVGAFFDHVDREDEHGFHGAAEPGLGRRLFGGARLLPPSVIIQDELHLISGPLGTVAALYEVALDRLASRRQGDRIVRPKIVASTAMVRRADTQIRALFDRPRTAIFPPPGPDRRNSFFAITEPAARSPGRLYVGLAAPGKGPKLLFLRALDAARCRRQGHAPGRRRRSVSDGALLLQRLARARRRPSHR